MSLRYRRHNDISQLQRLIAENNNAYEQNYIFKVSSAWMAMKLISRSHSTQKELFQYSSLYR